MRLFIKNVLLSTGNRFNPTSFQVLQNPWRAAKISLIGDQKNIAYSLRYSDETEFSMIMLEYKNIL